MLTSIDLASLTPKFNSMEVNHIYTYMLSNILVLINEINALPVVVEIEQIALLDVEQITIPVCSIVSLWKSTLFAFESIIHKFGIREREGSAGIIYKCRACICFKLAMLGKSHDVYINHSFSFQRVMLPACSLMCL